MSAKAIREYDGKNILSKYLNKLCRETDHTIEQVISENRAVQVKSDTDIETVSAAAPWINTQVISPTCVCNIALMCCVEVGDKTRSIDKAKGKIRFGKSGCKPC